MELLDALPPTSSPRPCIPFLLSALGVGIENRKAISADPDHIRVQFSMETGVMFSGFYCNDPPNTVGYFLAHFITSSLIPSYVWGRMTSEREGRSISIFLHITRTPYPDICFPQYSVDKNGAVSCCGRFFSAYPPGLDSLL